MVRLLILCLLVLMGVAAPAAAQTGSRHAAPDLEALLPTSLGGVALTVESQAGTDLTTSSAAFDAFLAGLGKTRADFSLASAYARRGLPAAVGAWRVQGADRRRSCRASRPRSRHPARRRSRVPRSSSRGRPVTRIGDTGQLAQGPLYVVRPWRHALLRADARASARGGSDAKLPR